MEIILAVLVILVGLVDIWVSRRELKTIQQITSQQTEAIIQTLEKFLEDHWKKNKEEV